MPASVRFPSEDVSASVEEARAASATYKRAVEERLLPTLEAACAQRDKAYVQVTETEQMDVALDALDLAARVQQQEEAVVDEAGRAPPALETRVNIGEEFYVGAEVQNLEPLVVDVGLGVLVEMSREEARGVVRERRRVWGEVAERKEKRVAEIRAHLGAVMKCLEELHVAEGKADLLSGREYILGGE